MNTINRATHREENGRVSINQGWTPSGVMNRLAAYEDTGLEPEEISKWKEALGKITSATWDRILQIVNAEQEGRLVVLPCKPDATFYHIVGGRIAISCFEGVHVDCGNNISYCCGVGDWIDASDIGKTVFLTRSEAEAALKGVNEDA